MTQIRYFFEDHGYKLLAAVGAIILFWVPILVNVIWGMK